MQLTPGLVTVTELGVAVTAIGIALGVLLPEQLFGDPLALELLMDRGPIRHDMAGRYGGIGLRIKQGSQSAIIKLGGQGPAKAERLGTFEEFLDGADTDLGTDTDLANREVSFQPQSQHFTNFTHCNPLGRHRLFPGKRESVSKVFKSMR